MSLSKLDQIIRDYCIPDPAAKLETALDLTGLGCLLDHESVADLLAMPRNFETKIWNSFFLNLSAHRLRTIQKLENAVAEAMASFAPESEENSEVVAFLTHPKQYCHEMEMPLEFKMALLNRDLSNLALQAIRIFALEGNNSGVLFLLDEHCEGLDELYDYYLAKVKHWLSFLVFLGARFCHTSEMVSPATDFETAPERHERHELAIQCMIDWADLNKMDCYQLHQSSSRPRLCYQYEEFLKSPEAIQERATTYQMDVEIWHENGLLTVLYLTS